ncbi:hypothetical protein [Vibrio vulnificus]|uniref:hypothetical protein n=1 Tax=Vibrio vulnificus TaxID=672 RepID=UPI0013EE7726|nr:hypothetical protein [Vibrio vulnificus]
MAIEKSLFGGKMAEQQPCTISIMSLYQTLAYPLLQTGNGSLCLVTNALAKSKRWEI